MTLLESKYLMENCDYSFGSITVGNTKSANLSNSEFIQKYMGIKNDGRSFMTLYIDNVRLYRDWETDRKSTRLNSSHSAKSRMPSSA